MRGTDLKRSWPFSENVKKEVAQALLPPMDVRKFRWWSHQQTDCGGVVEEKEVVVVVDRIQMQKICPVCGVFVAATVNAMNAHIDSCLAQTTKERRRNKGGGGGGGGGAKSRTPKKRSIAEIFAVAPPVKTMIIGNDCEEGEKGIGKQMIRDKLKATSLARSLVSAMKTIKAKNTRNEEEMRRRRRKKKKKKKKKKNKVHAIFFYLNGPTTTTTMVGENCRLVRILFRLQIFSPIGGFFVFGTSFLFLLIITAGKSW